jgi:hypothetical protein
MGGADNRQRSEPPREQERVTTGDGQQCEPKTNETSPDSAKESATEEKGKEKEGYVREGEGESGQ